VARGWPRKLIGFGLLALSAAWPASARAEEKVRLVYVRGAGADDCPAEVDLRLWVMARLGYDPFSPQASRVVISRVEARGDRLVSNLEVIDERSMSTGQRELTAKPGRCGELARALALSISLAIDPDRASQPATAEPAKPAEDAGLLAKPEEAPPGPKPSVTLAPEPSRATAEPPAEVPHGFASLALASSWGALPGASLGAAASFGLRRRSFALSIDALGQIALPRELEPRGQLEGALLGGGASLCAVFGAWEVCAVGRAAAQRLAAFGVARPGASYGLFLGVGPRLAWAVPLGRQVAFTAGLEGLLHLTRNSAQLSGREVWRTPPLGGSLQLGVRMLFL
jgi:hypothetical protein